MKLTPLQCCVFTRVRSGQRWTAAVVFVLKLLNLNFLALIDFKKSFMWSCKDQLFFHSTVSFPPKQCCKTIAILSLMFHQFRLLGTPCYVHTIESPSFHLCCRCEKEVPFRQLFLQELIVCGTNFHRCASLNTAIFQSRE